MAKDVAIITRMQPALKRELLRAKLATGMTVKSILNKALREWLDRNKDRLAAE